MPNEAGRRTALIIAYYFPPLGLSGVQRTAKFVKYLPSWGWEPIVLTCEPGGYYAFDELQLREIEEAGVHVIRTPSWDPNRLFGTGKYVEMPDERARRRLSWISQFVFIPDNKIGWYYPAVRAAGEILARRKVEVIFSSAPPYSSHLIAAHLARKTDIPLVLDFRDDWVGNPRHTYPTGFHRKLNDRMERRVLQGAQMAVAINEPIRHRLLQRHVGMLSEDAVRVIPQGFDPADFENRHSGAGEKAAKIENRHGGAGEKASNKFRILYSGVFYDAQRPDYFLRGLADVLRRRPELAETVEAVFAGLFPRSAAALAESLGVSGVVRTVGYVPHRDAVAWILSADVLWMTVGHQRGEETISTGKLYEYFGARKPILGLVPDGAARDAIKRYGAGIVVSPDDVLEIGRAIERMYNGWRAGRLPKPDESFVQAFDRRMLTGRLSEIFDAVSYLGPYGR